MSASDARQRISALAAKHGFDIRCVRWEDAERFQDAQGNLSCYGRNIADVTLDKEDKKALWTVRSENYNELLGTTDTDDVLMVVDDGTGQLANVTLTELLKDVPRFFPQNLYEPEVDCRVSIRFQTVFIPLPKGEPHVQFTPSIYSYNTTDKDNPRNLVLTSTSQGTSMVMSQPHKHRLWQQVRRGNTVHNRWMCAEPTRHRVGQEQTETEEEKKDLVAKGKATACAIGVSELGNRFNCLVTVQVPLKQKRVNRDNFMYDSVVKECFFGPKYKSIVGGSTPSSSTFAFCSVADESEEDEDEEAEFGYSFFDGEPSPTRGGVTSAARISVGAQGTEPFARVPCSTVARHKKQHITVTVTTYNITVGDSLVPSDQDIEAAIADIKRLNKAFRAKRLKKSSFTGKTQDPLFTFSPVKPMAATD
jgi:hypothetical protein